jgi:large subunit ribosomal protein L15
MNLSDVRRIRVPRSARKRVGRGWGSGLGKTSTRGEKGAGRRSGTRFRLRFEGGQMPLYRRLPKKGFSNSRYRVDYSVVNAGDLEGAFEPGSKVDLEALRAARLVPKSAKRLKILGDGEVTKAFHVTADAASAGAKKKIEAAGGTLVLPARPPEAAPAEGRTPKAPSGAKAETTADAAAPAPSKKELKRQEKAAQKAEATGGEKASGPTAPPKAEKGAKAEKPPKDAKGKKGDGGGRGGRT